MTTTTIGFGAEEARMGDQAAYRAAMAELSEVAAGLDDDQPLDDLLHLLCERLCRLLDIERCSLYLKDAETGEFRGRVAHYKLDVDDMIQRYIAGVPADGLTREILETGEAVLIADAQRDPRPVRSQMRRWGVQAIIGVPMIAGGEVVGLVFLDNASRPYPYTTVQQDLAQICANLCAATIVQAEGRARLRADLSVAARQNELLRRLSSVNDRFISVVLEGVNGIDDIARVASELAGNPCAILDAGGRRLAESGGATASPRDRACRDHPRIRAGMAKLAERRVAVIDAVPAAGLPHRCIVAEVAARGEAWGHVVIGERRRTLGALEMATAERAATAVALAWEAARRGVELERDLRRALVTELIHEGADTAALERRSDRLGVDVYAPHAVIMLSGRDRSCRPPNSAATADALAARRPASLADAPLLAAEVGDMVALVVPLEEDTPAAMADLCAALADAVADLEPGGEVLVGVSAVCHRPADYPRARFEAGQIIGLLREHSRPGSHARVLSCHESGAGRMLLASHEKGQLDAFLRDVLGPLLDEDDAKADALLRTISCYLRTGGSTGRTAATLAIHENSVRNRLARVTDLTGLDVAGDGEDRLWMQLAVDGLRLRDALDRSDAVVAGGTA